MSHGFLFAWPKPCCNEKKNFEGEEGKIEQVWWTEGVNMTEEDTTAAYFTNRLFSRMTRVKLNSSKTIHYLSS